jgi:hypothetical protein
MTCGQGIARPQHPPLIPPGHRGENYLSNTIFCTDWKSEADRRQK